jgi:hypothetical protein
MRRLTVTGFTDDGTELLLTAEPARSGPEAREGTYVLALDDRLWAALRHDRARLSQLQLADPAAVRPRDIQARVRAGQSPEEVAADAGVPVARVLAFALPVVAEREHMARAAQGTTLRRRAGAPVTLDEAVRASVRDAGAAESDLAWDAYRRDAGWIIEVALAGAVAHFTFDPGARSVVPDDDAAKALVAEEPDPVIGVSYEGRGSRAEGPGESGPRVAAEDPEAGDLRRFGVTGPAVGQVDGHADDDEPTVHVAGTRRVGGRESGRGRRTLRYLPFRDDDGADPASVTPAGPSGTGGDPLTPELELGALFDDVAPAGSDGGAAEPPRTARASRRPAVPSWDEIMFGRKDD